MMDADDDDEVHTIEKAPIVLLSPLDQLKLEADQQADFILFVVLPSETINPYIFPNNLCIYKNTQ
jgi:hypothetical protein